MKMGHFTLAIPGFLRTKFISITTRWPVLHFAAPFDGKMDLRLTPNGIHFVKIGGGGAGSAWESSRTRLRSKDRISVTHKTDSALAKLRRVHRPWENSCFLQLFSYVFPFLEGRGLCRNSSVDRELVFFSALKDPPFFRNHETSTLDCYYCPVPLRLCEGPRGSCNRVQITDTTSTSFSPLSTSGAVTDIEAMPATRGVWGKVGKDKET